MRLNEIIEEIRRLRTSPSHRSTMDICRMLENNKRKFLEKLDEDNFDMLLSNFSKLSDAKSTDYDSTGYTREYEQAHSILSFYLDRII